MPDTGSPWEQAEVAIEALRAIRQGEVDAFVVAEDPHHPAVYSLSTADRPYRLMVERMMEGAAVVDHDGVVLFTNAGLAGLLGLPLERLTGSCICDYEEPAGADVLERLVGEPGSARAEVTLRGAEGHIDAMVSATSLAETGMPNTCLIFTDLTELHRKQREVDELNARLADRAYKSESRLQALVDNYPAAIYVKDLEGRFLLVNRGLEEHFGLRRDQFLSEDWRRFVPAEVIAQWQASDRLALEADTSVQVEEPLTMPDGEHVFLTVKLPMYDAAGVPYAVGGVSTDITERKRTENEMRRLNSDLTGALKELDAFAYSVSHDLRAPLRAITGFSQILADRYEDVLDDNGRALLERVQAAGLRMNTMIDDLLWLSRTTRAELQRRPVDLSETARLVMSELREAEPGRSVEAIVEEGLTAFADPHLTRQVLANLLGNAWKFTSKRPQALIEVGGLRLPEGEVFFVRDNGAGFDMDSADRLFTPFQRCHSQREYSGTGIGLATVERIVHRHSGRVWAIAAPGRGATFFFTLTPTTDELIEAAKARLALRTTPPGPATGAGTGTGTGTGGPVTERDRTRP